MSRKRRKQFKAGRAIAVTALLVVCGLFAYYMYGSSLAGREEAESAEEELPVALNHLLSNDVSDLQQTKQLDRLIERFMGQWAIKGLSLAVMKDEKLIYAKGYGWADKESGVRMDVNNIMRIASVSKLITAAAVMKLSEDGVLSLSDKPFSKDGLLDLPRFQHIKDRRARNITIEHLLRHKGGFTLRGGDPLFSTLQVKSRMGLDSVPSPDEVIAYALSRSLGFTPGSGTRYSNLGYLILTRVIEQASGKKYEEYVKEKILEPAEIYDMHLGSNGYERKFPNEVKYYEPENQELIEAFDGSGRMCPRCYGGNNIEGLLGAGGWIASPTELLLLVAAIDGKPGIPDILSSNTINTMTYVSPGELPIGWSKVSSRGDWSRTGTLSGSSALIKCQKSGYSWAIITNTSSWNGSRFPKEMDNLFRRALLKVSLWPERNLFEISQRGPGEKDPLSAGGE
jgi:CubicO group peptidase (beta-lactamase class C family)